MTASDSSSSVTDPSSRQTDRLSVDLVAAGLLPPLPAAFVAHKALDLLAPLGFGGDELPDPRPGARAEIAAPLAAANRSYGHPAADALADKFADPNVSLVVTGQQPGLFGGPLYTLSKAVAATLWAEKLEAAGRPAVAVFWVATEDHDFREVSQAHFAATGEVVSFELGDDAVPLLPVGMRTLGQPVAGILEELAGQNPGDRWQQWVARLAAWYRPDARFGEAFSRLLAGVLGERCPLLLDSMLPVLKSAQQPWLERLVREREAIEAAFIERDERITGDGFPLQVSPQRGASPLFVLHGQERRRVEWRGQQRFALRGSEPFEADVEWLLELIGENPAAVSAGVMGRSALQDAVLGTTLSLLGPGELSYMPQVAPVYRVLGISAPAVALRPQMMVLARHQRERFETLDLELVELLSDSFELDEFLARGEGGDLVTPVRESIARQLDDLKAGALAIDGDLERPWDKTRQQVEKALGAFSGRLTAAIARRDAVARSRLEDLLQTARPGGKLQERVLSTAHFPGKFGDGLATALFDQLGLDPVRLHVITPGEAS